MEICFPRERYLYTLHCDIIEDRFRNLIRSGDRITFFALCNSRDRTEILTQLKKCISIKYGLRTGLKIFSIFSLFHFFFFFFIEYLILHMIIIPELSQFLMSFNFFFFFIIVDILKYSEMFTWFLWILCSVFIKLLTWRVDRIVIGTVCEWRKPTWWYYLNIIRIEVLKKINKINKYMYTYIFVFHH